jgi:Uma2 family endonuclease
MQAGEIEENVPDRRITVAEYYRMGELGIIKPDDRVELLDGVLIPMPPIGPAHGYSVTRLNRFFVQRFGDRASVHIQGPVRLDKWSEPQPDVMLNTLPEEQYAVAHPTPDQTLLVVEVSVTSLSDDRGKKLRAYARHGVREYWIVDVIHERVEVYREPRGERFRSHRTALRGESVALMMFPDEPIPVDDILPPRAR